MVATGENGAAKAKMKPNRPEAVMTIAITAVRSRRVAISFVRTISGKPRRLATVAIIVA